MPCFKKDVLVRKYQEFWKDNIEGLKHVYFASFLLIENWM